VLQRVVAEADEAADDMTACLLRPVSGAEAASPRIELLDVDAEDLDSGFARRFLEASECRRPSWPSRWTRRAGPWMLTAGPCWR
jgi:hypothetical protein